MWGKQSLMERGSARPARRDDRGAGRLAQHQIRFGAGLAERRRTRRRRAVIALVIVILLSVAGILYELRLDGTRISHVQIFGGDPSFADIATRAMQGSYFGIIPRNSTFFYPGSRIRAAIIDAHPDIAAISMFRNGVTGLSIKVNDRVAIARWCGLAPTPAPVPGEPGHGSDEYCYVFDASGFIFAAAATTTKTVNAFALYAPLAGDTLEPLRATLAHAEKLPGAFDFARELKTLGSPVTRVIIRGDEVDNVLESGTRITYVLGNEQNAFTALVSARDSFNLADGSVDYIDLRFGGKVYLKRRK